MNPNLIKFLKAQDLQLSDVALKNDYYNLFFGGNVSGAQALYQNNPQLHSKALDMNMINTLINGIMSLENKYKEGVTDVLEDLQTQFVLRVDELILAGEFSATEQYEINNFVYYNKDLCFCIKTPPVGTAPTNTEYWINLGLKGEQGYPSLGITYRGAWSSSTSYIAKDFVTYENAMYVARESSTGSAPSPSSSKWLRALVVSPSEVHISTTEPAVSKVGDLWIRII